MSSVALLDLGGGVDMPAIALGTFRLPTTSEGVDRIHQAINVGFRHIDAATFYGNEAMVGDALATAPVDRSDLFVATKVWPSDQGYESTLSACRASLDRLRLDYVDLYMLHWPADDLMAETWRAMEKLASEGLTRSIGVCNFGARHFDMLATTANTPAAVNQIEMNPFCYGTQRERAESTLRHGAVVAGYRPFANGAYFEHELLVGIARAHQRSVAQVLLRWQIDHGFACVPGWAPTPEMSAENLSIFDFELSSAELEALDELDEGLLTAQAPPEATP